MKQFTYKEIHELEKLIPDESFVLYRHVGRKHERNIGWTFRYPAYGSQYNGAIVIKAKSFEEVVQQAIKKLSQED